MEKARERRRSMGFNMEGVKPDDKRLSTGDNKNVGGDSSQTELIDLSRIPSNQIWDDLPKHLRNKKKNTFIRNHSDLKVCSTTTKFYLLMWKNWLTLQRRWKTTLIEAFTPVLIISILTICVSLWPEDEVQLKDQIFRSFQIKSSSHFFHDCDKFVFVPNISLVQELADKVGKSLPNYKMEILATNEDLEKAKHQNEICAGIVFNLTHPTMEIDHFPALIKMTIRTAAVHRGKEKAVAAGGFISRGTQWDTEKLYPSELLTGPRNFQDETGGSPGYYHEGFLFIQHLIAEKIIEKIYVTGHSQYADVRDAEKSYEMLMENILVRMQRFPYPTIKDSDTVKMIHDFLPLVIVISYLVPVTLTVWGFVVEKQSGIRIHLKGAGISLRLHRYAWIFRCLLLHTPSAALITAILATNWTYKPLGIFTKTDPGCFFVLLVAYLWQTICTTILLNSCFHRASTASATMGFLWFATYAPYFYVKSSYNDFSLVQRLFASVLGNTAISLGCHLIAEGEATGTGVTWLHLYSNLFDGDFNIGLVIIVLVCTGFCQILLARYVSAVWPEPGIPPLPWNFLCKMWFWQHHLPPEEEHLSHSLLSSASIEDQYPDNFEVESYIRRRKELQVEKITKYINGKRVLHKINLFCYENFLTVIIGDGKSGKGELLSIISGLTPWTKGNIVVSRHDMGKNRNVAKAFCSYCSNKNVLYPCMTIEETLHFFVQIKGVRNRLEAWDEVQRFLDDAMLREYQHQLVSELTISAKRILMVACAFIGGSRVVLLEDPASHMSSGQKRMMWKFIDKQKKHRTVIAAMESFNDSEAVVDKVVILSNGEAHYVGSPRFLQMKFGGGYHLVIEKDPTCSEDLIIDLVQRRVKDSTVSQTDTTLDFFLPEENSPSFPGLFEELEKKEKSLGIQKSQSSFITMDEVLVNIKKSTMEIDYDPYNRKGIYQGVQDVPVDENYKPLKGCDYWGRVFRLLLMKNVRFSVRRRWFFVITTFAPVIFMMICFLILESKPFGGHPPPLIIGFENYKNKDSVVDCFDATHEGKFLCNHLKNVLRNDTTFGSRVHTLRKETIRDVILSNYSGASDDEHIPIVGVEINSNPYAEASVEFTGYFSNQPLHVPALALNIMDNAMLEYMVAALAALYPQFVSDRGFINHFIQVTNHPLPFTAENSVQFAGIFLSPGFILGVVFSFGISILVSSFIILHIKEQDFKQLQMMSGASAFLFWGANYLWNFLHFTLVSLLITGILAAFGFGSKSNSSSGILTSQIVLFFVFLELYGLCMVCFIGAWSLLKVDDWSVAFSRTFLSLIFSGPLLMLLILAMCDPTANFSIQTISNLHNLFLLFPNYSLGIGVFYIMANSVHSEKCESVEDFDAKKCPKISLNPYNEFINEGDLSPGIFSCCYHWKKNPFDFIAYGIGRNALCMLIVLVVSLIMRVLKESPVWAKMTSKLRDWAMKRWVVFDTYEHEIYDYDVLNEALRVAHGEVAEGLVISNLTKEVPGARKVNSLSFEVDKGECFCLLGDKGSGKTSTIKMMAGTMLPTEGDVAIYGISLKNDYKQYVKKLGYCPDATPLLMELTGRETLELIGTLRRIPHDDLEGFITNVSLRLTILHELENMVRKYDENCLRKLCTAVAMLGNPDVILLDEPTTGIDLDSREFLFKSINNLIGKGSIVVFTSNSVAECESVCTKMAVMVNGTFKCFGTPEHLRSLFCEGFTVIVRFVLDDKKVYFTTLKDRNRVHDLRTESEEKSAPEVETSTKYFDENVSVLSMDETSLYPERANAVAMPIEEEEDEIVITTWEEDLLPFIVYFERNFKQPILVDKQPGFIHYHVREGHTSYSTIFTKMESAKACVAGIESYYIGQSNLDQVYTNFCKGQKSVV